MPEVISDIIVTSARLWRAPVGTALPADTLAIDAAWPAGCVDAGYTLEPVKAAYTFDVLDVMVQQEMGAVKRIRVKEALKLATVLAELTAANLALAFAGDATTVAPTASTPGYEEFSVTPDGFDPTAGGTSANPNSFGQSYAAFTVEAGARLSQALYLNLFLDAGNVYREARQYNPLRLYRGLGIGAAVISPLGPLGLDVGYALDKVDLQGRPDPGWKLHFRLGNFF